MRSFIHSFSLVGLIGVIALCALPGCDNEEAPLPTATGGTSGTGGDGAGNGVPLAFNNGWLNADENSLGVQGAVFAYADNTTKLSMTESITDNGASACITGTAAKVVDPCTITDPNANDCYGEYWGAAIGFNLNQPVDEATGEGGDPMPFDLSSVAAIDFELAGSVIPTSMRFTLETDAGDHCTIPSTKIIAGPNHIELDKLVAECWTGGAQTPLASRSSSLKIAWQVVTTTGSETPFDFCVTNVVAVPAM